MIWNRPTKPGARPTKVGIALGPKARREKLTIGVSTAVAKGLAPAAVPVGTTGEVTPRPVAKIERTSPVRAGAVGKPGPEKDDGSGKLPPCVLLMIAPYSPRPKRNHCARSSYCSPGCT